MKPIIIEMKELSESAQVYESRPHPFMTGFIYMVLLMAVAAGFWMAACKLEITVKGDGVFKAEADIVTVSSKASGKVTYSVLEEGRYVQEGELLFSVEETNLAQQLAVYRERQAEADAHIELLSAYLESLDGDPARLDSLTENRYYPEIQTRRALLENTLRAADTSQSWQTQQVQQRIAALEESIAYYEKQQDLYEQAQQAVRTRMNAFSEEEVYFYTLVQNYLARYRTTEEQYGLQAGGGANAAADALNALESEQLAALEQQLINIRSSLLTLNSNLKTAQSGDEAPAGTQFSNSQAVLTEKNTVQSELLADQASRQEYADTILELETALQDCRAYAPASGYLSLSAEVPAGGYIQQGSAVCRILPAVSGDYTAEIYISNHEIGTLREGQPVKFEIAAYPSDEYGYFTGTIDTISRDSKVSGAGAAYYVVQVRCDSNVLHNKKGEEVRLMNGMACRAKVVTDTRRVLLYLLQKIDLID